MLLQPIAFPYPRLIHPLKFAGLLPLNFKAMMDSEWYQAGIARTGKNKARLLISILQFLLLAQRYFGSLPANPGTTLRSAIQESLVCSTHERGPSRRRT